MLMSPRSWHWWIKQHRWALNVSCSMMVGSSGAPMIVVRSVTGSWIRKISNGLTPIIEACHEKGMEFGLWIEPEMVSQKASSTRLTRTGCCTIRSTTQ